MIKTICFKDLKLFFSDKKSVLITFLLPILLISLFAFAFGGIDSNNSKPKTISLLISDLDSTKQSKLLIQKLETIKGLKLIPTNIEKANDLVRKGKHLGVLILGKGFENAMITNTTVPLELIHDDSRTIEIGMLKSVLMEKVMPFIGKKEISKNIENYLVKEFVGITPTIKNKILKSLSKNNTSKSTMAIKMTSVVKEKNKKTNIGLIQAVAGTAIMMLLFSIAEIGGGLLEEKEAGTLKRLLYSPIKPTSILFGKMSAAIIIAILQLLVMLLFAWLIFKLPIFNDLSSLLVLIVAIAFAVASFGIFLAAIAKSRKQLSGLSSIIILTMSAIGGSMIPIFVMPEIMQKIAVISLNYWGIQGFYDIFYRSLSFTEILPKIVILLIIGLVMSFIAIKLFKRNLMNLV